MKWRYVGVFSSLMLLLLTLFLYPLHVFFIRQPVAKLFPFSTVLWSLLGVEPLVVSHVLSVLLIIVPLVCIGYVGDWLKKKQSVVMVVLLVLWFLLFWYVNAVQMHH